MRPSREAVRTTGHAYFISTQTAQRKPFFRHERWAGLLQEVLEHCQGSSYLLHAFIVMPDHMHALLTPVESLERAVQKIKGGFSFRAKRAFDWSGEIWQPGFSDHRIRDVEDWDRHMVYIRQNPVKAGLCQNQEGYRYLKGELDSVPQWLKPQ